MVSKTTTSTRKSNSPKRASASTPNKNKSMQSRPQTRSHNAKPGAATRGAGGKRSPATPPAASVAAAQKVLRAIERREDKMRTALKRQKKTLKRVKKTLTAHRASVKSLKSDLDKVSETRKSVSDHL